MSGIKNEYKLTVEQAGEIFGISLKLTEAVKRLEKEIEGERNEKNLTFALDSLKAVSLIFNKTDLIKELAKGYLELLQERKKKNENNKG